MERYLVGDVGGTKVHMALCEVTDGVMRVQAEQRYVSADHGSLLEIVRAFRQLHPDAVDGTGIGVAGPVFEGRCQATNLPWVIDSRELENSLPIGPVALVNDFEAAALGVLYLGSGEWIELNPGRVVEGGPIAVLGAGTGLGEAFLFHAAGRYRVVPTEGGHKDFAPRNDEEVALLRFLGHRHGRVSYERVVSGAGLRAIYDFLVDAAYAPQSPAVLAAFAEEDDPAVISRFGLAESDLLCAKALDMFASVYGAETGNLALQIIATGGVYVTGGIGPKNVTKLLDGTFQLAYRTKGRFSDLVASISVRLVTNPNVSLLGATAAAMALAPASD